MTKEEIESLLTTAQIARFCSLNEDGTIHAAPVWYRYANGEIIIATPNASRKVSNIRRNRNVTILVDVEEPTVKGVLIYGKAQLENMDTRDRYISEAMRVFERHMSRDEAERYAAGLFKIAKKGVKITIRPERIVSFDTSKDETLRNAVRG
jgi:nitroimidazol reductase NimA-like FMN-containing flavoprotein (pyridoxamine 5'-phosphate oxidase superfamily)